VGAGNSGTEIALDLCGIASRVRLSVRTPPLLIPVEVHGLPMHLVSFLFRWVPWRVLDASSLVTHRQHYADLAGHGLPTPPIGAYARFRQTGLAPVAERGFAAAVRDRRIHVVPAVEALERDAAVLAGGERLHPDAVILATGYEPVYAELVDAPGAFDDHGRPVAWGGALAGAPGLFVVGAPSLLGDLHEHGREARRVRRAVRGLARAAGQSAEPGPPVHTEVVGASPNGHRDATRSRR
jgi:putative flavoprotein involved in K+ transport